MAYKLSVLFQISATILLTLQVSENEFDINNEATTPISDYVEIHRNVVNNQIETGCFIQIKIR